MSDMVERLACELFILHRWGPDAAPILHETELHRRFRRLRERGEWFRHEGALAAYIDQRKPGLYRPSRSRKKAA